MREYFRPEPLAEHAGHPAPSTCRTAAGRRSWSRLVLAATLGASYGIYGPAFELLRARAARAGQRGVPRLGEVRGPALGPRPPRQPARRSSRASTASGARTRRCSATAALRFHATDNDQLHLLQQDDAGRRQRRSWSSSTSTRTTRRPAGCELPLGRARRSTPDEPFQVHDLLGGAPLPLAAARATTSSSTRTSCPAHVFRVRRRVAHRARLRLLPVSDERTPMTASARRRQPTLDRTTRSGTRTRSSTSCTSARSPTATATASATSAGLTQKLDYLAGPRRHRALAAAVLPVAAAGRRLRHRRLHRRPPRLRHAATTSRRFLRRGAPPRPAGHHRAGLNHTSDQHPWFQRARRAPPGSRRARLLRLERHARAVPATRASSSRTSSRRTGPGTRSPSAYYWHRFYSHQPDLNFDNPRRAARRCSRSLDFWLEMGVDGLRLDAVPYLYEREGTNCENLPETHDFLQGAARARRRAATRTACCWPRRTSGRRTPSPTSATATSATWPSTSRSCRGCSWRCTWRTASRSSTSCEQTPAIPDELPVGACSCATTTS